MVRSYIQAPDTTSAERPRSPSRRHGASIMPAPAPTTAPPTDQDAFLRAVRATEILAPNQYAKAMALVIEAGYRQATAPLAEVIATAHASGAVCLLAHPGRGEGEIHRFEPEEIEALLRDVALDGVEVYYPSHTDQQVAAYAALARQHGLLASAGSDSHGPRQRAPIAYPSTYASELLFRLGLGKS